MINYEKFRELINKVPNSCEIGIYFDNKISDYLIVKFDDYISIGRFNCNQEEIYKFNSIDELYNSKIEDICLKYDWNKISDILFDLTFSVIDDKEEIRCIYDIKI